MTKKEQLKYLVDNEKVLFYCINIGSSKEPNIITTSNNVVDRNLQKLLGTSYLVLRILLTFKDVNNESYPSYATIAEHVLLPHKKGNRVVLIEAPYSFITKSLHILEECGLIKIGKRENSYNGMHNVYTINKVKGVRLDMLDKVDAGTEYEFFDIDGDFDY